MSPEEKAAAYTDTWNSEDPAQAAAHFTAQVKKVINHRDPHSGTAALEAIAAGFHAEFPDLQLTCDAMRAGGNHAIYLWTLKGHHVETDNLCVVSGWEEWDLDADMQVTASKGWSDAEDYQRQIDGA